MRMKVTALSRVRRARKNVVKATAKFIDFLFVLYEMKVISEIASNIKVISSSLLLTFAITSVCTGCATKSRQTKNEREAGYSLSRCLLNKW